MFQDAAEDEIGHPHPQQRKEGKQKNKCDGRGFGDLFQEGESIQQPKFRGSHQKNDGQEDDQVEVGTGALRSQLIGQGK